MKFKSRIPFFTADELACKCCGLIQLDMHFAVHMPVLRLQWGRPLSPSSVCRCPKHNTAEGGHPRSLHLTDNPEHPTEGACAADIRWHTWSLEDKLAFARLAWKLGWSIGLNKWFCHIDRRKDIGLQQRVFLYSNWPGDFEPGAITLEACDD